MEKCKFCGSELWKNGVDNGVQRYRCKKCFKCFSNSSPKYSAEVKEKAINMYLNNCGIRKIAMFIGCAPSSVINWIREKASTIELKKFNSTDDIIEMDEIYAQVDRRLPHHFKKNAHT